MGYFSLTYERWSRISQDKWVYSSQAWWVWIFNNVDSRSMLDWTRGQFYMEVNFYSWDQILYGVYMRDHGHWCYRSILFGSTCDLPYTYGTWLFSIMATRYCYQWSCIYNSVVSASTQVPTVILMSADHTMTKIWLYEKQHTRTYQKINSYGLSNG